jgi:hypothetical protein
MIGLQPPASQIFSAAQAVSAADVAAQGFPAVAAIQADHVVGTHRLAHRDSGGQHFFDRSLSSKLTKASVHGGDEVRKLTGPDCIMSQVTPDDFRREKWIDRLSIHGSLRDLFFTVSIYKTEERLKHKNTPRHQQSEACYMSPIFESGAVISSEKQRI